MTNELQPIRLANQTEVLCQEIFDLKKVLFGRESFFHFGIEKGTGTAKKHPVLCASKQTEDADQEEDLEKLFNFDILLLEKKKIKP